ncbi:MAG: hypothetical protein K0S37_1333 [Microbacterium sp.]|nr:hypothetical protein [Microbacterium sp.]
MTVFAHNNAAIVYSPWNWHIDGTRALTNNSGAYFKTLITGSPTGITLNFDVSSMIADATKIAYRIDRTGGWQVVSVAATVTVPLPARTSAWQKHMLEVVMIASSDGSNRWASPYVTAVKFTGIDVTGGTPTLVAPTKAPLTATVLGDSITEGDSTVAASGSPTVRSDGTLGWAFLLGELLGAEVGVIGFARQGITWPGGGNVPALNDAWNLQAAGLARSFAVDPDAVIINHGTNDAGNAVPAATFTAGLTTLLNNLLAQTTKARIMVIRPFNQAYSISDFTDAIAATTKPSRITLLSGITWTGGDGFDSLHPGGWANLSKYGPAVAAAVRTGLNGPAVGRRIWNGTTWVAV